jgi:dTDP-4-dehydrorhamnose 3,5-epimerase
MEIIQTKLQGCLIIQPKVFADERGYFVETFNEANFRSLTGILTPFVQDNESKSDYGVVRGLHFQIGDYAQAKLVRVTVGRVIDVAVDIRPQSPTYLQHITVELSGDNKTQLYVPRGFAHGFSVLENNTIFNYKCDNLYSKANEGGLNLSDPILNINWQIPLADRVISEKDSILPSLSKY